MERTPYPEIARRIASGETDRLPPPLLPLALDVEALYAGRLGRPRAGAPASRGLAVRRHGRPAVEAVEGQLRKVLALGGR